MMARPLLSLIASACYLVVVVALGRADGLTDTFAGAEALFRGDHEEAIHLYTHALATGGLRPDRAVIARLDLATAYAWKGEYSRSIIEFDSAIHIDPGNPLGFEGRGHANFLAGRFADAASDFEQALRLAAGNHREAMFVSRIYDALWLHLARIKSGQDDKREFARNTADVVAKAWPHVYAAFFRGLLTEDELINADLGTLEATRRAHACLVPFWLGEHSLLVHDLTKAKEFLRQAHTVCSLGRREYYAATSELKRIEN